MNYQKESTVLKKLGRQTGFTLVELLVGLVLSVFLAVVVGTMFVSSRVAFNTSSQVSRVQENLRFASNFIQRDLRESAYSECGDGVAFVNRLDTSNANYLVEVASDAVRGFDFADSGDGDTVALNYELLGPDATVAEVNTATASNAGNANNWNANLPSVIAALQPIAGSDIVVISRERKTDIVLNTNPVTSNTLNISTGGSDVGFGHILRVGDCRQQEKFQNNSTNANQLATSNAALAGFNPGNNSTGADNWRTAYGPTTPVYAEELIIYYIGTGASGLPSLFVYRSECGLTTVGAACETPIINNELVEGVENMQVKYGEDTDDDDVANVYSDADSLISTSTGASSFSNVVSLRVGLLMRSIEETEDADTQTYVLADNVTINPPDERLIRYSSNMTVHLRNRGL